MQALTFIDRFFSKSMGSKILKKIGATITRFNASMMRQMFCNMEKAALRQTPALIEVAAAMIPKGDADKEVNVEEASVADEEVEEEEAGVAEEEEEEEDFASSFLATVITRSSNSISQ